MNLWKSSLLAAGLLVGALPATAATYAGNGNGGFGDVFGVTGSLDIVDDGTSLTFTLNRGAGTFSNTLVIYIDSIAGGFADTTTLEDEGPGDLLRSSISGDARDNGDQSEVTFSAGFLADYAIAAHVNSFDFAGLFALGTPTHTFVADAGIGSPDPADATFTMTLSLADLGLTPGDSFDFAVTYLNGTNAFRSDEAIGDGIGPGNPGANPVTFTAARTYTTVPEPTVTLLGGLAGLFLLRRRR